MYEYDIIRQDRVKESSLLNRTRSFMRIDRVNVRGLDALEIVIYVDPSLKGQVKLDLPVFKSVQVIHPWGSSAVLVTTPRPTRAHTYEVTQTSASPEALKAIRFIPKGIEPKGKVEVTVESLTLIGSDRQVVVRVNDKEVLDYL